MKLRVGFFSFTSDEGCMMVFLELLNKHEDWLDKLEITHCKTLRTDDKMRRMDVAFVEGAISSKDEEKELKEIRDNSRYLVAIGSCAAEGSPSNQRNSFDSKTKKEIDFLVKKFKLNEKILPLKSFVAVDEIVAGCPMDEEKFTRLLEKYMGI